MSIRVLNSVLAGCLLAATSSLAASKVVRFLTPTSDTVWLRGNATGLGWEAGSTVFLAKTSEDGWIGYSFPDGATTPAENYGLSTRDYATQFQASIDFTKGDTAWVFPDPFPSGAARVVYARPRTRTVLFWNPWQYDAGGRPPRMQLEGGTWNAMTAATNLPGWYSYYVRGFSAMSLAFSDSTSTKYVGAGWGLPASYTVDASIVESSDTIWVRPTPELSGGLVATAKRPAPKVAMVFNPWDGRLPVNRPLISFGGGAEMPMVPAGTCGWYSFDFFERSGGLLFTNDHGGQAFGAGGLDSKLAIDVSAVLAAHDTVWIARDSAAGTAKVKPTWSGEKGHCEKVLLAATIRDFPTDGSNREFAPGRGCQRGNWGGIKGMVSPYLDAMRKPVRSPYDTGWNGVPTSWGGHEYGFRCTFDTLPALQAEIGDTGIATTWFRTVPGKNAETCRDIPLMTDSVTGDYVYDDPQYFPIDDFEKLADGSKNPYRDAIKGSDGKAHNYSFCLESHGEFEYRKGQIFDFRGDDDVWFFIDHRIVVDLGGIHGPWADSVLLDSINAIRTTVRNAAGQIVYTKTGKDSMAYAPTDSSLVEGKTYDFDFFFCERNPQGSSMRIRTDMNLRTLSGFQMRDSTLADGSKSYEMWVSRTTGQGCAARGEVARTVADRILLSGPSAKPPVELAAGRHYGGIVVATGLGSFTIDTTKITGLAPGRYELQAISPTDASDIRRAVFVVPWTPEPRFVAKAPWTGSVGSSFPVDVASFNEAGDDSSAVAFQLHPVVGLRWFLDSALTRPVPSDSVLRTPRNHMPLRLWVRGDSAGMYTLVVGRSALDSTDGWGGVEFLDKGLRFVDSLGRTVAANAPVARDVGDTVRVRVEAYNGSARCASCADSIALAQSFPGLAILDSTGRPVVGIRLSGGAGSFLVVGAAPVESASVAVSSFEMGRGIVRSPLSFRRRRLAWTPSAVSIDTSILVGVGPFAIEARGVDGVCVSCGQWVRLASPAAGIAFVDPATGARLDSVRLVGGKASVSVMGSSSVSGATVAAAAPGFDSAVLGAFAFRTHAPDSGAWYDDDGDGTADRASVALRHPWNAATTLRVSWPDTSAWIDASAATMTLSVDSLLVTVRPAARRPGTYAVDSMLGRWSRDGADAVRFPMRDRVAPVAVRARLRWGDGVDTLRIAPSEAPGILPAPALVASFVSMRTGPIGTPRSVSMDPSTGEIVLLFDDALSPLPGDSVRFAPGGVADAAGNRPGATSRRVAITGVERPPRDALMLDVDGDGAADRVVLRFASAPTRVVGYRFRWGISGAERVTESVATASDSGGLVQAWDLAPFAQGATACPATGCAGLGAMLALDGADTATALFAIRDGVAPVAQRARLRWGNGFDTLRVAPSEPLASALSASPLAFVAKGAVPGTPAATSVDPSTGELVSVYASGTSPLPGDSVRLAAGVSDAAGNHPGANSRIVAILGTDRPPRNATVLDTDGDGAADRVVLRFAAAPTRTAGFRFRWGSTVASLEERITGTLATESDSGGKVLSFDLAPFAKGVTSCPDASCAGLGEMFALDGDDTVATLFPTTDGVAPVMTRARLRYAAEDGAPDTLLADFSEPVVAGTGAWVSWNVAAGVPVEMAVPSATPLLVADGRSAVLATRVDSFFHPRPGDLARIASGGGLVDASGNVPGSASVWVPIEFGPRPVRIEAKLFPAVRRTVPGMDPLPGEASLRILLQDPTTGSWRGIDGTTAGDTARFSGLVLSLNAPLSGELLVYDNLGTYVVGIGLAPLAALLSSPDAASWQDGKGAVRAWIAWNGASSTGRPVADGVYTFRLVGFAENGAVLNRLFRGGRQRLR